MSTAILRNSGFSVSYDSLVLNSSSVPRLNFGVKYSPLRKAGIRCGNCKEDRAKNITLTIMTRTEITKAYSNGEFEMTYKYISDNAEWTVIDEDRFVGKQAILDNCEQVGNYFKSATTDFKTLNIIAEGNKVVINGTAVFLRNNKRVAFVSACDIYEFNDNSQIQIITSYCIQSK